MFLSSFVNTVFLFCKYFFPGLVESDDEISRAAHVHAVAAADKILSRSPKLLFPSLFSRMRQQQPAECVHGPVRGFRCALLCWRLRWQWRRRQRWQRGQRGAGAPLATHVPTRYEYERDKSMFCGSIALLSRLKLDYCVNRDMGAIGVL